MFDGFECGIVVDIDVYTLEDVMVNDAFMCSNISMPILY